MTPSELSAMLPRPALAVADQPAYRYDRASGRFLPANDAAWRECDAWNQFAHRLMVRLGTLPETWNAPRPPFLGEHRVD